MGHVKAWPCKSDTEQSTSSFLYAPKVVLAPERGRDTRVRIGLMCVLSRLVNKVGEDQTPLLIALERILEAPSQKNSSKRPYSHKLRGLVASSAFPTTAPEAGCTIQAYSGRINRKQLMAARKQFPCFWSPRSVRTSRPRRMPYSNITVPAAETRGGAISSTARPCWPHGAGRGAPRAALSLTLAVVVAVDVESVEQLVVIVGHQVHCSSVGLNDPHDLRHRKAQKPSSEELRPPPPSAG